MNKPDDWRAALVTFAKTKVTATGSAARALQKENKKNCWIKRQLIFGPSPSDEGV